MDLRESLAGRLRAHRAARASGGDDRAGLQPEQDWCPAAVLVPLVVRETGLTVLLTRRTDHLTDHPGQIAFPGGRTEPGDADPEATALREAEEECGLARRHVELLGLLPDCHTVTGYRVTPVVGLVAPPFRLAPDAFEVAEVFEMPLAFLLDPANHRRGRYERDGVAREYWAMPWGEYHIWGATAGMLYELYLALRFPQGAG